MFITVRIEIVTNEHIGISKRLIGLSDVLRFNYFLSSFNGWLTDLANRLLQSGELDSCETVDAMVRKNKYSFLN